MTAEWKVLTQLPIGASIQSVVDSVNGILATVEAALKLLTGALEIVKALALATLNLLKSIVEAVLALLEELIFDLLEYNVAAMFHVNINWNPYWVFNKEKERDPRTGKLDPRLVDFENDRSFPWAGSGLVGWLLEILASSKDPTDPFRPVTDANTSISGTLIIKGVANPSEAANSLNLQDWVSLFTSWRGFEMDFGKVQADPNFSTLSKLATTSIVYTLAPLYGIGPKDQQFVTLKNSVVGFDAESYSSQYIPTPGAYPKWISIPMASVVPPLQALFSALQECIGTLRYSEDISSLLSKLIQAIQNKLATLGEALQQVQDALTLLAALAAFLTDAYILSYGVPLGGMDIFISDVLAAEDAPDFGNAGIVVGMGFFSTSPDSQVAIDKFLGILGIETSAYATQTTAYVDALDETFQELFP